MAEDEADVSEERWAPALEADQAPEPEPEPVFVPPPTATVEGPVELDPGEEAAIRMGRHWRRRRFLLTTLVFFAIFLLMNALIHAGTDPLVYAILLTPFWAITLLFTMRTPRRLRPQKRKPPLADRLSFGNKLTLSVAIFVAIYLPFTFISNKIIPFAPIVEFFTFAAVLFLLYRLAGRSVGVAPAVEALPPSSHRLHKQIVLPLDDPHYQQTLFLNFEFVDKGRGAKQLARRLDSAMDKMGIASDRRQRIVEDLEDYREGISFGFALTRRGRERRNSKRDRRNQVLRTVYTKFNQELEQAA